MVADFEYHRFQSLLMKASKWVVSSGCTYAPAVMPAPPSSCLPRKSNVIYQSLISPYTELVVHKARPAVDRDGSNLHCCMYARISLRSMKARTYVHTHAK